MRYLLKTCLLLATSSLILAGCSTIPFAVHPTDHPELAQTLEGFADPPRTGLFSSGSGETDRVCIVDLYLKTNTLGVPKGLIVSQDFTNSYPVEYTLEKFSMSANERKTIPFKAKRDRRVLLVSQHRFGLTHSVNLPISCSGDAYQVPQRLGYTLELRGWKHAPVGRRSNKNR